MIENTTSNSIRVNPVLDDRRAIETLPLPRREHTDVSLLVQGFQNELNASVQDLLGDLMAWMFPQNGIVRCEADDTMASQLIARNFALMLRRRTKINLE